MLAYSLSTHENKKVLLLDLDEQAEVTKLVKRTFNKEKIKPKYKLMESIADFDLRKSIVTLNDNLDLVHGDWGLEDFDDFLINNVEEKGNFYLLYTLLNELKYQYDYIIIDTKPSTSKLTTNAICASDYVIVPTKASKGSTDAVQRTYNYLYDKAKYNEDLELIGIVPYLESPKSSSAKRAVQELREVFQDEVFENVVTWSDRVLTWEFEGVTEHFLYDRHAMKMYKKIVKETISRIEKSKGEQ